MDNRTRASLDGVFPAHAGMNRIETDYKLADVRVPRACGDEPAEVLLLDLRQPCSLRMRG